MWNGSASLYNSDVFYVWAYGSVSGSASWNGTFCSANASVCHRNCRNKNRMDLYDLSGAQKSGCAFYFLSGVLDHHDYYAGNLFLDRAKKAL